MHSNPTFRNTPQDESLAFARERGFGVLAISSTEAPLMSHVPFIISNDGRYAELHLMRSNPIARATKSTAPPSINARLAVSGPDSYISPDWYGIDDQVPTWNYVAVHLVGTLTPLPQDMLPDLLDRLSTSFEERLEPKPVWSRDKMTAGAFERMQPMIRPFRLDIHDVQSTWKLGQNKPDKARTSAAQHVAAFGIGAEPRLLSAMMKSPTPKDAPT